MSLHRITATASALALLCAAPPAGAGTKYAYDSAGRLIQVEYSSGVTINYSYDAAGNRRTITTTQLPNRPPVAVNDTASVAAGGSVNIQVRANDSDPDRNALTISAVSAVLGGGTAVIAGGGTHIRFTAPAQAGVSTFTYTVSDSKGGTNSASVTVTVGPPPNRQPAAVNDSATVVASGSVDIMVRSNDSDPDGDPLAVTALSTVTGGGTATIGGGGTHVRFAAPATAGTKSFTYTIADGRGGAATATVSVVVTPIPNRPPVAVNDSASVAASGTVDIQVRTNDSDPDGDPLTVTTVSSVSGGGTATIMGGGTHVRYNAPATGGARSFTYTISDGRGGVASATIAVTVAPPPNRAPVAQPDYAETETTGVVAIMVLANDSDPDGDPLTVTAVTTPISGTATIAPGGGYIFYSAPASIGQRTFNYTVSDGRGLNTTAKVTVVVTRLAGPCTPPPGQDTCVDMRIAPGGGGG